ncbi:hypothetical protein RBV54_002460 [Salmonella enterica]|nr:hypothetical protein [Salmonella enterica subsp. enterica serovar Aqua]ELE9458811.1 hypothetical protein [Salmonella enterica]ELF7040104.1 hypothetical protein [Salmonella enterica]
MSVCTGGRLNYQHWLKGYIRQPVYAYSADDVPERCLDALFEADVSSLCQILSEKVVAHLGLQGTVVHFDITSFHVDGVYDCADGGRPDGYNWCRVTVVTIGQT